MPGKQGATYRDYTMKLKKQAPAKLAIAALTGGLFAMFLGLIRANPRISAQDTATPTPQPTPDYQRFFSPERERGVQGSVRPEPSATPQQQAPLQPEQSQPKPHTRSRAS